jgi:hypothetical protein
MLFETAEQIKQLLVLESKQDHELRAICDGLGLPREGNKRDLVQRLIEVKTSSQMDITKPQAIPLRTRDDDSNLIEAAKDTFLNWRKLIFEKGGKETFSLLNSEGKPYSYTMKYIKCSARTAKALLSRKWYLPLEHQKDLITAVLNASEMFDFSIIQKPDGKGSSWLMMHCKHKSIK